MDPGQRQDVRLLLVQVRVEGIAERAKTVGQIGSSGG